MLLQMDNARPHTAVITQQYLSAMGLRLVYQSPYSPDLNLCDRFLFTSFKEVVRPIQYDSNDKVVKAAQHCLRSLGEDYYLMHEFHKFLGHCKAVIRSGGDYVTCSYCRFYVFLCNSVFYCLFPFILIQTKYIK